MTSIRSLFRTLSLSLLLVSCGGGGGADAPVGVVVVPTPGIELLAGGLGGSGTRDDAGEVARFNQPFGIAVAADGTRYVADNLNHTIRKVTPAGVVSTFAGKPGVAGHDDGVGTAARFNGPSGIAIAADGTLYVTDAGNYTLRAIASDGTVSTLAGVAGTPGAVDGPKSTARLGAGAGIVVASDGTIYFCEIDNRLVRKFTTLGEVKSVAGLAGVDGVLDGTGAGARFSRPVGLAIDGNDVMYVADATSHTIRRVTTAGVVDTWAGTAGSSGLVDNTGAAARFNMPYGMVAEADGTLYVADTLNRVVRKITPAGGVSTLASLAGVPSAEVAAPLPTGIARDGSGLLSVTDSANHRVLTVTAAGVVATALGAAPLASGTNGTGAAARFFNPFAMTVANDGKIYVADTDNHVIRVVASDGTTTTLAGVAGVPGSNDGTGAAAHFLLPAGIALDSTGTIYVADAGNHVIRKITPAGVVTTFVGSAGNAGSADGTGAVARFNLPQGLAFDTAGNLHVADSINHTIRKVTPAGQVTTLAGLAGNQGAVDGTGAAARFYTPVALAVAPDGSVFVADQMNHAIRKVTAAGVVSTWAGSLGQAGDANGAAATARFSAPGGIGLDANGILYVADRDNHLLRTISAAGDVATLAGVSDSAGVALGPLPGGLNTPLAVAPGVNGELYVSTENSILKVTPPSPVSVFDVGLSASAATVVQGQSLTLSWNARDAVNCVASGDWSGAKATGGTATVTPAAAGTATYTLTCDENGGSGSKSVSVGVTVTTPVPGLVLTGSAAAIAPGTPYVLTWTGSNVSSCTASDGWSGARATSGSETLVPAEGLQTYTLTCTGPGGSVSRTVTVSVAPPPAVTLTASATSVAVGTPFTLTWSSSNTTSCTASGAWAGARGTSGSEQASLSSTVVANYSLSCTGAGGTKIASVTVSAQSGSSGGSSGGGSSGGGGGGGALDPWWLLVFGGLLLRRRGC